MFLKVSKDSKGFNHDLDGSIHLWCSCLYLVIKYFIFIFFSVPTSCRWRRALRPGGRSRGYTPSPAGGWGGKRRGWGGEEEGDEERKEEGKEEGTCTQQSVMTKSTSLSTWRRGGEGEKRRGGGEEVGEEERRRVRGRQGGWMRHLVLGAQLDQPLSGVHVIL